MKRRLGWIVIVGIFLFAIIFFAVALISARTELAEVKTELATTEFILSVTSEEWQIECFLRTSVVLYTEGRKKEAYRFLEYAIFKMDAKRNADLSMLPAKMLKDPRFAKKLGLTKLTKKGDVRRFGGG